MSDTTEYVRIAAAILLPNIGGFVGTFSTRPNIKSWYNTLQKPWWTPPNWVFGPMWTYLYATMGYASYLVWRDGGKIILWHMWPITTKWSLFWGTLREYYDQNFKLYFIAIKPVFYIFWCKTDNSGIFLSKVMKFWTLPCMILFKTTWLRFGLSKYAIYLYFNGPIKKQCSITPFPPTFSLTKAFVMTMFCMTNIQEELIIF